MSRAKYLAKNTVIFAVGNLGTKFINFFLVPLYTNVLTTSEYGVVDLIFTICSFVVPIMILNINEAIMRFTLDHDTDNNAVMSVGIIAIISSLIFESILGLGFYYYKSTREFAFLIYIYAVTLGINYIFVSFLRGKELLLRFSIGNIIQTFFVSIFNIIFLVQLNMGIKGYLIAYILANMLTCAYAYFAGNITEVIRHIFIDKKLCLKMISYSVLLIPNSFMWWIMNSSDRIMLTCMVGIEISGIYAVANKIPAMISIISTVFNQAFSYSAIKEEKSEDKEKFNNQVFEYLLSIVVIAGISLIIVMRPFMKIYVGDGFQDAWKYTSPLIVAACILVLATFLSVSYTVHKDSKGFLVSGTMGAIANIILNIILIPRIEGLGAAIATLVAYFVVLIYRFCDTKKYCNIEVFSKKYLVSLASLCVAGMMPYLHNKIEYVVLGIIMLINIYIYRNNWLFVIKKCFNVKRK